MKVKHFVEDYYCHYDRYTNEKTENGKLLDDMINEFIADKKVIDIKYSALVMYEEEQK